MFKLAAGNRLKCWKQFRTKIGDVPLQEALTRTQRLWQSCPFTPFYLDENDVNNWPDPWQLVMENYYCDLAKALGMLYTINLTSHQSLLEPEIRIYHNTKTRHSYYIAYFCQGKYVLNLIEDEVVNKEHINQNLKLKHRYTAADLKLEQY